MKIGSLFSGYGGLDMAVEAITGATPAWFCEWDEAPSKILNHHWPHVPNLRDVTQVDWSQVEPVDIITGGSPCQDLSAAGKRAGMVEGTRSNLWVNMREAIAVIKPRLVVWENVRGALSATATSDSDLEHGSGLLGGGATGHLRALGRVLGDLTDLGYDTRWTTVQASDVGAPHHRARVFLIATPADAAGVGEGAPVREGGLPLEPRRMGGALDERVARLDIVEQWGAYAPAVRRWERIIGSAPAPTEPNSKGKPLMNAAFSEWMMGLPSGHVTAPGIGLTRAQQLKAIGNGVCPQQASFALSSLLEDRSHLWPEVM